MKAALSTQLGQQLHLTPQLLQSIRLLQLDGLHLEQEIQRLLDSNPLLEIEEAEAPAADATDAATTLDTAAFDELPESSMWDVAGASWQDGDDDRMARIAAGESTDPQLRVLQRLSLDMDDRQLAVAAFWLDHCDEAGYLQAPLAQLQLLASAQFDIAADGVEAIRQQLLHGEPAGMAAQDLREGLQAQLRSLHGVVPARHLAARILDGALDALAATTTPPSPASTTPRSTTCAKRCA
jgi:RNA polymerase sigma-54 factor